MKRKSLIVIAALLLFSSAAFGQEVYRWVDEQGTAHFTDDLGQVPEKYRDQIQKKEPPKEPPITQPIPPQPTPSQPLAPPTGMEVEKGSGATPRQKDILGRGEDWWRAKVNEWNEKLKNAQRNYENAYSEWKSKENDLESSKFKPDSVKRKLKTEIKDLEEKTKDWEKQMDEAKNMLENILPKQAQDYQANPEWLKIEERK
jgi:peptidoglycan hydrolase CwlO-like protein